jgi:hypothetical protein
MGYTHYWRPQVREFNAEKFAQLVDGARKIIEASGVPLADVNIDETGIRFNGVDADSHEDFWLLRDNARDFEFCKTAEKPYDIVCVAILCLAHQLLGDEIEISSDGGATDWEDGLRLLWSVFGEGDFPFDEDGIRERFTESYAETDVLAYRRIRADLGLPAAEETTA